MNDNREQQLARLERVLAELRGEAVEDTAPSGASEGPSRAPVGSPATWAGPSGAQYQPLAPRPPETPPVTLIPPALQPIMDREGHVVGWTNQAPAVKDQSRGIDVMTQRMVGGGILLGGGGVGIAFLLRAAEAAVIPLALIAVTVCALAYLKSSAKSGGGGGANISVNVKVNQRNG